MSWRDTGSRLELFIRDPGTNGNWVHYSAHRLKAPDHLIPNGSKGWATYQKLRDAGYVLVKADAPITSPVTID